MKATTITAIALLLCTACQRRQTGEQPIAQVFESTLFPSELAAFIPKGATPADSTVLAQNYIRNWVTQKLLLYKAISNLSGETSDIQKQVEDYRTSLLIHEYKQQLIAQRLKDDILPREIEEYYQKHLDNFLLPTPIAKALFFILPKKAPNLKEVRKWFLSDREEDREHLENYCLANARKYDNFNDNWIEIKSLLNLLKNAPQDLEKRILNGNKIETEDENNYYFLKTSEIKREQTTAPIEYVRKEITLILKNKKKLAFEKELEKQINEEGYRKNYVKIY